ncbi:MAG: carbohydrate binding domain-containing protein [Candidatus Ornithomonoglobus sp.]
MEDKLKRLAAVITASAALLGASAWSGAVTLDRAVDSEYIIWSASASDMSKQKGDALDADGNLTLGWTPDNKSGETNVTINGITFIYYLSHSSENGGWDSSAKAAKGPSLKFTAPQSGVFTAYITNMNSAKTFYISEGGGSSPVVIDSAIGSETGGSFAMSINVEAGKDYYAYVNGSKGSFCGAAFEPGAEIIPPENLLTNGDFETGSLLPFVRRSSVCAVSSKNPHGGDYCAYVSGRSASWTGIQYDINDIIEADGSYRAAAWIRLADNVPADTDCNFYLQLEIQEEGREVKYPIIDNQTAKSGEWIKLSGIFSLEDYKLPLSRALLYICSSDTNTADFYADDFEIYSTGAVTSQYPPITEFPTTANDFIKSMATVDFNIEYQEIAGFGGSGAFGTAQSIKNLPSDKQSEVLSLLFDKDNGIGLTVIRNMLTPAIGETPGTINLNADEAQGWLMEQGKKYGADKIMTTCWTPPAWMKDNNSTIGGSLASEHYQDFAAYLADYVEEYKKKGIDIDIISPCNEPDLSPDYDGCTWTAEQIADFIKNYLKPELVSRSMNTKILAAEEMRFSENMLSGILADKEAADAVDIFGVHGYGTSTFSHLTNVENTGKPLWMTEIMGYNSRDDSILDGLLWAKRIYQAIAKAGANEWNFWYLAHQYDGGNSAIIVLDNYDEDYMLPKRYYTIGNYSKYIRPGAKRVESTLEPNTNVYLSAYKNTDGKEVIVAVNGNVNEQSVDLTLNGSETESFDVYRTSDTESLDKPETVKANGKALTITLPARSVTTYVTSDTEYGINSYNAGEARITVPAAREAEVIFAEYDNGTLVKADIKHVTLTAGENTVTSDIVTGSNTKVMLWSSVSEMLPLYSAK